MSLTIRTQQTRKEFWGELSLYVDAADTVVECSQHIVCCVCIVLAAFDQIQLLFAFLASDSGGVAGAHSLRCSSYSSPSF